MVQRMSDAAESVGAKTVVIPECGHAFGVCAGRARTCWGRPLPYAVMHISEYMAQLEARGKTEAEAAGGFDNLSRPCQISRRGGATQDARYLLQDFAQDETRVGTL